MTVIATGEMHTVREFIEKSFRMLDMPVKELMKLGEMLIQAKH